MNIKEYLKESIRVKQSILDDDNFLDKIKEASNILEQCLKNRGKILLAGNGGSAADSQHISAEFVSRFMFDRPGLPSIALTTDTSALTAIGNDYGFENLFSRQLQAIASEKDVFIGISTSGNSPNIIKAIDYCRKNNIFTIGMTGSNKGKMDLMVDILIDVPSNSTSFIQESHITIGHILCMIVERNTFNKNE